MTTTTTSQRAPQRRRQPVPNKPVGLRVLVADDEHLVAASIISQLETLGYEPVGPVGTGREALATCRQDPPDLALLDIRMPDGDGITTARSLLRELMIPSVILSAYSDQEYVRQASESGVFAYLIKPAEGEQLRATLDIAWGRFQRFAEKSSESDELRQRLADRKVIERAKWVLVTKAGVDESTAMRLLLDHSRRKGERLVVTAKRVIQTGDAARDSAPDMDRDTDAPDDMDE